MRAVTRTASILGLAIVCWLIVGAVGLVGIWWWL